MCVLAVGIVCSTVYVVAATDMWDATTTDMWDRSTCQWQLLQRIHIRVLEAVAQMYDLIIVENFIENFKFKISFLYFACF